MKSSTDTNTDHYRILGISSEAGQEEIRAAYRAKLRLWHPDLVADETEEMRQAATEMSARLNEAYGCLSDPHRRSAYDTRRGGGSESTTRTSTSPPGRSQSTRRSGRRVRDTTTISMGGIVLPLIGLAWASGLLATPTPANPPLIAALCAGAIAATIWLLTSSRLLRRPDRLARVGVVWSHLMRWSGWILIGGCVVFLGIPAVFLTLIAVVAAPFSGLVVVALISSRFDSQDR